MKKTIDPKQPAAPVLSQVPAEIQVPASAFTRYPENRVPHPEAVESMRASIESSGLLSPILARRQASGFEIVAGETRWRACQAIHAEYPVRCFIIDADDREAARLHAIENFQRAELDPIEKGRALANMRAQGWCDEEILRDLGVSIRKTRLLIRLYQQPEAIQEAVRGGLAVDVADCLAGLPEEVRLEALQAVLEPALSSMPLGKREALELLRKNYVEPQRAAAAWEERRGMLQGMYPTAKWVPWAEAQAVLRTIGWVEAEELPHAWQLAAAAENAPIPTWGALAERHGQQGVIAPALEDDDLAAVYLQSQPLIDAELAAHDECPGECIFAHPAAAALRSRERLAAHEKAMMEEDSRAAERDAELELMVRDFLERGPSSGKKRAIADWYLDQLDSISAIGQLEALKPNEEGTAGKLSAARRWLRRESVGLGMFDALGRLVVALELAASQTDPDWRGRGQDLGGALDCGFFQREKYPALAAANPGAEEWEDEEPLN